MSIEIITNILVGSATVIVAWIGQQLKSRKSIPTPLAQAIVFGVAFGLYALGHHPTPDSQEWFNLGLAYAGATVGASSVMASTKLAPKTDTK